MQNKTIDNTLIFIGEIITPYKELRDCPHNISKDGVMCEIKIYDEYKDGLFGLKNKDKIDVLYWFDKAKRKVEIGKPFRECGDEVLGTFGLRSPHRPNPIALASVYIEEIKENSIFIRGLDCLSGTKLLDIKPAITVR